MRIIVTGDRSWPRRKLAEAVLRHPLANHGRKIIIVSGEDTGVDEAVVVICRGFKIQAAAYRFEILYVKA